MNKKIDFKITQLTILEIFLYICGIILLFISLFFSVIPTKIAGLFFIILGSLIYGLSGGLASLFWSFLLIINSSLLHGFVVEPFILFVIIAVYFLVASGVGKAVDIFKEQEKDLAQNKQLLERTQSLARIGGWEYNVKEDKLYWTEELYRLHGFSDCKEIDNLEANLKCYPEKSRKQVENAFNKALTENKAYDLEVPFIDTKGNKMWVRTVGKPITERGQVIKVIGTLMDITERKEAELEYKRVQHELHLTQFSVDKAAVAILRLTPEGEFMYANDRVCNKLGYSKKELLGKQIDDIVPGYSKERRQRYWQKLKEEKMLVFESEHQSRSGETFPVEVTTRYLKFNDKEYEFAFVQDITERKAKEKKLKHLSYRDHLTNLYNRRFLEEKLDQLSEQQRLPLTLIMADINGLSLINDTYGYQKGDEILIEVAQTLSQIVRSKDIIGRWSGDTFVILMPDTAWKDGKKMYHQIKEQAINMQGETPISLGMGMAVKNKQKQDIYYILNEAEKNMYQDKLTERKSSRSNLVKSLVNTLVAKSQETKQHTLRMVDYALKLGEKVGLSHRQLNDLSLVAMLHDIGKTSISEEILKKPGKLTESEWEEITKHPQYGYNIAHATEEISHVAEDILAHHEKWDGSGYPNGLKGEEISILARIIAIIDAYDVMTNKRPYKKKQSKEYAIQELKDCADSQFDLELVEEFIEILEELD